jgi:hypothetical protein
VFVLSNTDVLNTFHGKKAGQRDVGEGPEPSWGEAGV